MLVLRAKPPAAVKVELPGAAFAMVRPATTPDVDRARAEIAVLVVGAASNAESLSLVGLILGQDFEIADLTDPVTLKQVTQGLARLKLAHVCTESWSGIGDEDGNALDLNLPNLALLLRDSVIADKFDAVIERKIHGEISEKNGSAASPNGAAAADEPIAPNAGEPTKAALPDSPPQAESSAPSTSTSL
jgi:hypothetical protein